MTDETLEQPTKSVTAANQKTAQKILQAVEDLAKRLDVLEKKIDSHDIQFQAIREGIVMNSVRFDRLEARILNLNADMTELTEAVKRENAHTPV